MTIINMFGLLCAFRMKLLSLLNLSFFVFILVLKTYDSIYKSTVIKVEIIQGQICCLCGETAFNTHVNRLKYDRMTSAPGVSSATP